MKLRIKGNYQIFPSFIRGIDFVGYRIFLKDTLLRKSTCQEFERKMTAIRKKIESGQEMNYSEWCAINSYKGWLKYCDSSRLSENILNQFSLMLIGTIKIISRKVVKSMKSTEKYAVQSSLNRRSLMTIQFGLQRTSPRSQKPGQMNSRGSLVMNMT